MLCSAQEANYIDLTEESTANSIDEREITHDQTTLTGKQVVHIYEAVTLFCTVHFLIRIKTKIQSYIYSICFKLFADNEL